MRGVIKCELVFNQERRQDARTTVILRFLKELPWSPPFLDHHEEISPRLQEVFEAFPSKESYLNEANLKTIYIPTSESWGAITEATVGGSLDIRLTNKITENLKQACDEIVAGLINAASLRKNRSIFRLRFRAIQILGSESDFPIYIGEAVEDHLLNGAPRAEARSLNWCCHVWFRVRLPMVKQPLGRLAVVSPTLA
jgi:hypothetical protein